MDIIEVSSHSVAMHIVIDFLRPSTDARLINWKIHKSGQRNEKKIINEHFMSPFNIFLRNQFDWFISKALR